MTTKIKTKKPMATLLMPLLLAGALTLRAQQPANKRLSSPGTGSMSLISDTLLRHKAGIKGPEVRLYFSASVLYRMAKSAALHKKYAVALQLFRASLKNAVKVEDPVTTPDSLSIDPLQQSGPFLVNYLDTDTAVSSAITASFALTSQTGTLPSRPVKINRLLNSFQDGKKAISYGLYIHVKQPIPGKRKRFKWFGSVGHSFITLIKYNQDGSLIQKTFGFYPRKRFVLEATPVIPFAASDFKNDSLHNWDESVGLFISKAAFRKIIRLSRKYARKHYHLSRRNCTDFALAAARKSGLQIMQTSGKWPLGAGNDPGDTGQSLLERKIKPIEPAFSAHILMQGDH